MRWSARAALVVAAALGGAVLAVPAAHAVDPAPPGPALGPLPASATGPGGAGTPALDSLVSGTCASGGELAGAEWFTLPSGASLGDVRVRAQGVQIVGRSPDYLPSSTALVDWVSGTVLACGAGPAAVGADTHAAVVVWYDPTAYHAAVDGCSTGDLCAPPSTEVYAFVATAPADNDDVAAARPVSSLPFDDTGDSSLATSDGPVFPDWCSVSGAIRPVDYGTVWWRWTAPSTGWVRATAESSVFRPTVGAAESTADGLVALDTARDAAGCPVPDVHVVAGHTYAFAVHTWTDEFWFIRPLATGGPYALHLRWIAPPAAPTALTASTSGTNGVAVSWTAPAASPATEPVTGYHVSVVPTGASGATPLTADVDASTLTAVVPGLSVGTTYTVSVRSDSVLGLGPAVSTVFTLGSPTIVPTVPPVPRTSLVLRALTHSMTLAWAPPAYPGGTLVGYRVTRDGVGIGGRGPVAVTVPATQHSFTFTYLRAGTTYHLTVAPLVQRGGVTVSGAPVERHGTLYASPRPPTAPRSLTVTVSRTGRLTVHWSAPLSDGQAPIMAYVITRSGYDRDGRGQRSYVVPSSYRSFHFDRLVHGRTYTFTVRARNVAGSSPGASTTGRVR